MLYLFFCELRRFQAFGGQLFQAGKADFDQGEFYYHESGVKRYKERRDEKVQNIDHAYILQFRPCYLVKYLWFFIHIHDLRAGGGTGRHARLRGVCLTACGFDSRPAQIF